jgi:3-oxoacyl-[acyl-carrier-protein] synthase III
MPYHLEKYGYIGTACIPMALDDAIELGKIKRGDLVVSARDWAGTRSQLRCA